MQNNNVANNNSEISQELTAAHVSTFCVETLARLHAECFDNPWDRAAMLEILLMPSCFGYIAMKNNDVPCGLVLCQITAAADEENNEKGEAEILTIGVISSLQKQGIATFLLKKVIERAKEEGIGELFLEVSEFNEKAISLYEREGFMQINVRPKYYRQENPPADALIFSKNI
ncbi:MAG: GNAT family N-acetyltransferase [Alphaproteobacteria bacterium]|nr:GNAT family N-acetyltransferase [Alphaproteobacteria bacterium]